MQFLFSMYRIFPKITKSSYSLDIYLYTHTHIYAEALYCPGKGVSLYISFELVVLLKPQVQSSISEVQWNHVSEDFFFLYSSNHCLMVHPCYNISRPVHFWSHYPCASQVILLNLHYDRMSLDKMSSSFNAIEMRRTGLWCNWCMQVLTNGWIRKFKTLTITSLQKAQMDIFNGLVQQISNLPSTRIQRVSWCE